MHWNIKVILNMKHSSEVRHCINCGSTFEISIYKERATNRRQEFCPSCNHSLTNNQKRKIKMNLYPEYKERILAQKREEVRRHKAQYILNRVKRKAKKLGYEFNLTIDDIVIPDICPILEVPIVFGTKEDYEYSPSIDRIDNSKGYIRGNICIISKKANSMKNSASVEELKSFCKNVLRYSLSTTEKECSEIQDKELV